MTEEPVALQHLRSDDAVLPEDRLAVRWIAERCGRGSTPAVDDTKAVPGKIADRLVIRHG